MNHIDVMKQAIHALDGLFNGGVRVWALGASHQPKEAIKSLREAIEEAEKVGNLDGYVEGFNAGKLFAELEAEKVEPVAVVDYSDYIKGTVEWTKDYLPHGTKLYTAPPQREWVGLSHEEVNSWELPDTPTVFEFTKFIEGKIKEKNT